MRFPVAALALPLVALAACSREEEPVADKYERQKAAIEAKAHALDAQVENEVSALEARLDGEADALLNVGGNAAVDNEAAATAE